MSPVKSPPSESGSVSDLVARYQMVVERARISNVNAEAVFEVLRMEATEWHEDKIDAAIVLLKRRNGGT
jgi:hypothetical protein